jgi:carboxylesterase type B
VRYLKAIFLDCNVFYYRIQYAKANRWEPPIDLASEMFSNGLFEATSFGPCCPQRNTGIYLPTQDEQCLYLNIFTPLIKFNQSLLPVLFWVHGGGLTTGCSSQSIPVLYNGTNIIVNSPSQPVIVVTINYRLGVLANMYLTELIEENSEWPTAGNYNYLDILSALRWININIRDYGGNPKNILLFGESSGGKAVIDIGALKGSSNLYQHMISQSAGLSISLFYSNITSALQTSNEIVEKMNCTNENRKAVLVCLRNSSIDDLIMIYGNGPLKSVIDNYFFPYNPQSAIQKGKYNQNINMIIGANKYEQPYLPTLPNIDSTFVVSMMTSILGEKQAPKAIDFYHLNNCSLNVNAINRCSDITHFAINTFIGCSFRRIYNNIYSKYNQQEQKLFLYNMDCNPGICPQLTKEQCVGLCLHASELPFVFGTVSDYTSMNPVNCTWDNQTRIFSNRIISHWINMATKGEPLIQWPKYDPSTSKYFQLTPFQNFSIESWNNDCSIYDQIEQEDITEMFGSNNSSTYRNINIDVFFIMLLIVFYHFHF